jgi:exonuclease SbcD
MRILHTSDWHLGATLCGRKRYDEGEAFLSWLVETLAREKVETLIVAGDIFDTGTPSNRALEHYYRFLGRASKTGCRHIIITAGNHDSPSLLAAPKELLSTLDIHVIGAIPEKPEDEVLILSDDQGSESLIVCAVPFLRDKDIRLAEAGETIDEKKIRLLKGICDHYQDVCSIAKSYQKKAQKDIPIVATGHLFVAGGNVIADDGVRDLSVGNLVQVGSDAFPACIDYLALGHLHQPQLVGGNQTRRYCGAPITMGFGESGRDKEVIIVDITPEKIVRTDTLKVPKIRECVKISGDTDTVLSRLAELKFSGKSIWTEVLLSDPRTGTGVREEIMKATAGSGIDVLKIKPVTLNPIILNQSDETESLEELDTMEVFRRCLIAAEEPENHWEDLTAAYKEILAVIHEGDANES